MRAQEPRPASAPLVALLALALAAAAGLAPGSGGSVRAAAPLKAVVIVGPVGSVQSNYLADGARIADVAASYGMDVRRIFHPHATWANVLANIQGASIVVYLGHGNGWPSPYAPFQTTTKDGFGLNATDGSSTVRYYGEGPITAAVHLAPNAVVILNHACYTSGASEPGMAAPTPAVAMQRVDNFGAGFLRSGARAVFAFGGQDPASVIRDLMTTHRTMDGIFTGSGYNGGWDIRFPSLRTPGFDAHLDPAGSSTYYRSVVGDLEMTADEVTGAPFADTGAAPASISVPGNATIAATADLLATPGGTLLRSLDPGTPVRVTSGPVAGLGAGSYYGISSPAAGYVAAERLSPVDSAGPRATDIAPEVLAFSPNGDGTMDSLPVAISWSENAQWSARVDRLDGTRLANWSGSGPSASFSWDGTLAGSTLPDGRYRLSAWATDAYGNAGVLVSRVVVIDTAAPAFALASAAASVVSVDVPTFTPNGDGSGDVLGIVVTASEPTIIEMTVRDGASAIVRHAAMMVQTGTSTVSWDGRADGGAYVPDGSYTLELASRDPSANPGATLTSSARVLTALRSVAVSRSIFYSADLDSLAPSSTISFTAVRPATVDWTILGPSAVLAVTHWSARAVTPGTYTWTWSGRDAAGAYLPSGAYTAVIAATTAEGTVTYRKGIWVGPFKMTPSTPTLAVGRSVSVTIVSAESLLSRPTLTVTQSGLAAYVLSTTWISTRTYRVTFTPRAGATGAVTLKAYGVDIYGHAQRAYLSVPLP